MATTPSPPVPPLPSWSDSAAVASYVVSIGGTILGIVTLFLHIDPQRTAAINALLPSVGFVAAFLAQILNAATHRKAVAVVLAAYHAASAPPAPIAPLSPLPPAA